MFTPIHFTPHEIFQTIVIPFHYGSETEIVITLDGQEFEIDTGSFSTVIPKSVGDKMKLNPQQPSSIYGVDGVALPTLYGDASVQLDGLRLDLPYDEIPSGYGMQYPLLGRDFFLMNDYNLYIDFQNKTVELLKQYQYGKQSLF